MPNIQHHKQGNANVPHEEVTRVPRDEGREALRDNDQDVEEQPIPSEPGLPESLVGERVAGDVAHGESTHERDVAPVDAGPGYEARDGGDVEEPVEDGAAVVGEVEEGEESDGCGEGHGGVRDAAAGGAFQEGGC